jgi:hypothetical protein
MRNVLLLYGDESGRSEAEAAVEQTAYEAYGAQLEAAGIPCGGEALRESATATCVRAEDDAASTSDGPFAETHEQLGGFYLIDVPDLDHAIDWARRCPAARVGTVEIRPVMEGAER